jgi:hypothetical protein
MTTVRDLEYQAQYQKRLRAEARARGKRQLNALVAQRLVESLDAMKAECGFTNRNEALEHVLRTYFDRGNAERNPAVSA